MGTPAIGVLALQGAFGKHIQMLVKLGVQAIEVRKPDDLARCDGLIIPGGESTTMMHQIEFIHLNAPLHEFAKKKPVFGTCAGLILMAREIQGSSMLPFQLLDLKVERNAFGSQKESFRTLIHLQLEEEGSTKPFTSIFIRAPRIREIGSNIEVLAQYAGEPVLVKQGMHLGSTFHPELSSDPLVHAYFVNQIACFKKSIST